MLKAHEYGSPDPINNEESYNVFINETYDLDLAGKQIKNFKYTNDNEINSSINCKIYITYQDLSIQPRG